MTRRTPGSWPVLAGVAAAWIVAATPRSAGAGPWSPAYVRALPDEAFAVVESSLDGRRARRLPHHDAEGRVDVPHLRSALGRLSQVHWLEPASAERARRHLLTHLEALRAARRSGPEERPERRGGAR
jgi:hypothetical protein